MLPATAFQEFQECDEIAKNFEAVTDRKIHSKTVNNILAKSIPRFTVKQVITLNNTHKHDRLKFCKARLDDKTLENPLNPPKGVVMCHLDEKFFVFKQFHTKKKVFALTRDEAIRPQWGKGSIGWMTLGEYTFLPSGAACGKLFLCSKTTTIDTAEFTNLLAEKVFPWFKDMFGDSVRVHLQIDNAPSHASKGFKQWVCNPKWGVDIVKQPPRSPDLRVLDMELWPRTLCKLDSFFEPNAIPSEQTFFDHIEDAFAAVVEELDSDVLASHLYTNYEKCVEANGGNQHVDNKWFDD